MFEKLNAVVLLVPFALMIFLDARRRRPRHLMAALGGGVLGGLPLIIVNLTTWFSNGSLLSLGEIQGAAHHSQSEFARVFAGTLGIGSGESIRIHALGHGPEIWQIAGEMTLIATAAALALLVGIRFSSALRSGEVRTCALAYAALPVAFVLLPRVTHSHHWTLATPFQYLAIALALTTLWNVRRTREVDRQGPAITQQGALIACVTPILGRRTVKRRHT